MAIWWQAEARAAGRATHRHWEKFALLFLFALSGCTSQPERTFASCAGEAQQTLLRGFLDRSVALARECQGLARDEREKWLTRILFAEASLARRQTADALLELQSEPFDVADEALLTRFDTTLGYALSLKGDRTAARTRLEAARHRAAGIHRADLEAESLVRLDSVLKDPSERRQTLELALATAGRAHDPLLQAQAHGALGFLALDSERLPEAIRSFERALALAEQASAFGIEQKTLGNLGWNHFLLGNYELSEEYSMRAAELAGRTGNWEDQVRWLVNLCALENTRRRYDASRPLHLTTLLLARQHHSQLQGVILNNLAILSLETDDLRNARRYHEEASALKRGTADARSLIFSTITEGSLLRQERRFDESIAALRSVLADKDARPSQKWDAGAQIAATFSRAGRISESLDQYRRTRKELNEALRAIPAAGEALAFQASLSRLYRLFVDALFTAGQPREALDVTEAARAQQAHFTLPPQEIARRRNALILDYWLGSAHSYVWAIHAGGLILKTLPGESALEALVAQHQREVASPTRSVAAAMPVGQQLYGLLVGEVLAGLAPPTRVIVIPDGVLSRLNWETLVPADPKPHFWLEEAAISRAPSLASLEQPLTAPLHSGKLLIFGNPVLPAARYPALLRAEEEIEHVRAAFDKTRSAVIDRAQATAAAFLQSDPGQFDYLHFVAHGEASERRPLDSALVLSGETRLEAREVIQHPMRARLVTLSACHSAGTKAYRAAGLVGMGWAFLRAGAQNVVAGLWEVNDAASARLHPTLYRLIREGKDPAEALRQAKLELLRSDSLYRKPYYWGSWVMLEGRP